MGVETGDGGRLDRDSFDLPQVGTRRRAGAAQIAIRRAHDHLVPCIAEVGREAGDAGRVYAIVVRDRDPHISPFASPGDQAVMSMSGVVPMKSCW
ncbi:hypothetical protein FHU40_002679 [Nocardioides soli]|uniref:Uncharacterized protein n=1 Tax=Nocardioides soli TaxID=1036020 RepID=A0A7W4VW42_9ACTN|nr:hypothetical protein [Nocardioides soli]